ncbi:MAG: ACP S-malonyltransferase [Clostridiales bacterium]|nr:ACP S-malonyltransferase [Clostridiales bacterium]MCF8022592.1 ACP S-malonyltransferase [Clostridiales bacterium]
MKTAFLFPGQGSQYVGMGKTLYENYEQARKIFDEANSCLSIDLISLCFEGPEEELAKTVNSQPAILTTSLAYMEVLKENGIMPHGAAGHSLGEYSALVSAGSISFKDAVSLVRKRGEFMQNAVPLGKGGMAAVMGLKAETIQKVCQQASSRGVVEAVNLNCSGQVVIAGEYDALEEACRLAGEKGAKRCVSLPVSAPFHSSLMQPAAEKLAAELEKTDIHDPKLPVVSNVNADYLVSAGEVRKALKDQVCSPVRWQESVEKMIEDDYNVFLEVGPGKVLTGLNRKINRKLTVLNMEIESCMEKVLARVKEVF